MSAQIIDGKKVAEKIRSEILKEVALFKKKHGFAPGLATLLVGDDPASHVYVRNKNKFCAEVGMHSAHYPLLAITSEKELLDLIKKLNGDSKIHGILVQLPLPQQINPEKVLEAISPVKDVDGFHPVNLGNLVSGKKGLRPCTPYGVMKLIDSIGYDLSGKKAVVLGRSNIVGKPVALMLLEKNATVTVCHSKTKNIDKIIADADLVVAAIGKPHFVKGDWIKKGSVVIDVGINRVGAQQAAPLLVGDVDFEEAKKNAGWITPVPGGVGPMTIAMLLSNTLQAAKNNM